MIAFTFGTTGELIKLAPVLRRLEDRGAPLLRLCTAQQAGQILPMLSDFGLSEPDLWLGHGYRGEDLERPRHIPRWLGEVSLNIARHRRRLALQLRSGGGRPLVVVHGDTMTTVLGAVLGRLLRVPVAHIEAGMRSGDWRNPFPEELNRKLAARLTRIHFAPGPGAAANLTAERVRGEIIDTAHNTISDNLGDIPAELPPGVDVPAEPFGLVSLHRQELLYNEEGLGSVLRVLRESADRRTRLLFVDHPITAAAVDSAGLSGLFDGERFVRIPRQRYFHFLSMLKKSVFLVTDSGGSQEECAFMGHPCLIHRTVTEHATGLGGPVVLSRGDLGTVREFLANPERLRSEPIRLPESPSDRIVRHLEERGFLGAPGRTLSARTGNDGAGYSSAVPRAKTEHVER
jgi:UDP-N-acetylglucosamine 2-epimerase (non-hydrolysing)